MSMQMIQMMQVMQMKFGNIGQLSLVGDRTTPSVELAAKACRALS